MRRHRCHVHCYRTLRVFRAEIDVVLLDVASFISDDAIERSQSNVIQHDQTCSKVIEFRGWGAFSRGGSVDTILYQVLLRWG